MKIDPYQILGVKKNASSIEIKSAYRELVKKHHPDAGGDKKTILSLNAAWEILGDKENRKEFDLTREIDLSLKNRQINRDIRNEEATNLANSVKSKASKEENELARWLNNIYEPINKLLGSIINILPKKIRELSADPYDELLMESFCRYLEESNKKIKRINNIYQKISAPIQAHQLSLSLYHCFSQVEDGLNELERYTHGYVDNYLHDGSEMIREAKRKRKLLNLKRKKLLI